MAICNNYIELQTIIQREFKVWRNYPFTLTILLLITMGTRYSSATSNRDPIYIQTKSNSGHSSKWKIIHGIYEPLICISACHVWYKHTNPSNHILEFWKITILGLWKPQIHTFAGINRSFLVNHVSNDINKSWTSYPNVQTLSSIVFGTMWTGTWGIATSFLSMYETGLPDLCCCCCWYLLFRLNSTS